LHGLKVAALMARKDPATPQPGSERNNDVVDTVIRAEKMTQIAVILPAAVFVGWIAGVGLDKWLHQNWIYLVGIILGCVAGFVQIFRLVLGPENAGPKKTGRARP
jgi:ATP synthase protein I